MLSVFVKQWVFMDIIGILHVFGFIGLSHSWEL